MFHGYSCFSKPYLCISQVERIIHVQYPSIWSSSLLGFMDYCWSSTEAERKSVHDHLYHTMEPTVDLHVNDKTVSVNGPIIVGAGPSGLAVFACLKEKGLPSLILERSDCIGSLWQLRTYDRLHLHLSKQFCELPLMSFPPCFPTYPTKQHFIAYLEAYTRKFDIRPLFNRTVENAEYDQKEGVWNVRAVKRVVGKDGDLVVMVENYVSRWLVVATGENAEAVVPEIDGMEEFKGDVLHTSQYRRGDVFVGKKVLVVGCGNSGMEVCLDLCNHGAFPTIVVREGVHVLPRDMFGRSTFALSRWLLRWFPTRVVDAFLLLVSRLTLGDTACVGLHRPLLGPLELKSVSGKSPVLDIGTLAKIKSGDVKVAPAVRKLSYDSVEFVDGRLEDFDAVILATGYRSNVPFWLKEEEGFFSQKDGMPRRPFPNGWKGKNSLYAVGFTKLGILGCSMDARRIADDIEKYWSIVTVREEDAKNKPTSFFYPQQKMSAEMGGTRFKTLDSVHYVSGF